MKRFTIIAIACVVCATACGGPEAEPPKADTLSSSAALSVAPTERSPAIPASPVEFTPGMTLYTARNASAYTVIYRNPAGGDFVAYGFDPKNFLTVFYVRGAERDLPAFQAQHHLDVSTLNIILGRSGAPTASDAILGQYIPPPPKNPPMGQDGWKVANTSFQANQL